MRVVRFYVSLPAFFLPPSSSSFLRRTSAASSGSEGSLPDLHRKLGIKVFSAGPPPQAPDQSVPAGPPPQAQDQRVPRRTSTASSGSKCSPPDLHRELRIPCRSSTVSSGSECSPPELHRELRIRVFPAGAPPRAPDQSVPRRASTTKNFRRYAIECQKEFRKIWHISGCFLAKIECQTECQNR